MIYEFVRFSPEHRTWYDIRQPGDIIRMFDKGNNCYTWAKLLTLDDVSINKDMNLTDEINDWLKENNISYPFRNIEDEMLFKLRFE